MTKSKKKKAHRFNIKTVLISAGIVLLLLAVVIQIAFDIVFWQQGQHQSTFELRTLIGESINNLTDTKTPLTADYKITELRLQLPVPDEYTKDAVYLYNEKYETTPADVQVTTKRISMQAVGQLNVNDMDTMFKRIPAIQSCLRGIKLEVMPTAQESANKTKSLQDGRVLSMWREAQCNQPDNMDKLEAYLLQAQSY